MSSAADFMRIFGSRTEAIHTNAIFWWKVWKRSKLTSRRTEVWRDVHWQYKYEFGMTVMECEALIIYISFAIYFEKLYYFKIESIHSSYDFLDNNTSPLALFSIQQLCYVISEFAEYIIDFLLKAFFNNLRLVSKFVTMKECIVLTFKMIFWQYPAKQE